MTAFYTDHPFRQLNQIGPNRVLLFKESNRPQYCTPDSYSSVQTDESRYAVLTEEVLSMDERHDVELVIRALAGEMEAFEALYHRYSGSVFRTIQAIVRDRPVAEDLLQETFVRAYRSVDQSVDSIAPWLHRIGINLSYSRVMKRRPLTFSGFEVMAQALISPLISPERMAERSELQRAVWDAVEQLNDKYRVVIVLYYVQDLSVNEIAERLDLPLGTVKSRLYYARKLLRALIETDQRLVQVVGYATS